jgi:tetratricopeptide (TPR) repeat protein
MGKKKQQVEDESPEFAVISWLKHIGIAACYGLVFMFLVTNILLSQVYPDFYNGIFIGDKASLVSFFKKADTSSYFPKLKEESSSIYKQLESEITSDVRNREKRIQKLEGLLKENPKSRDVLYALSILYEQSGDMAKSQEYLEKARSVDPSVGI